MLYVMFTIVLFFSKLLLSSQFFRFETKEMRTKLIHIPGAWSYPHTRQARPRNTQACSIFWYDSFATKLWNDFRIAANAMIITMLVCFYLFVLQYFKFNSIFVIILFSSANLRFAAWLSASQGCKRKSSKFA